MLSKLFLEGCNEFMDIGPLAENSFNSFILSIKKSLNFQPILHIGFCKHPEESLHHQDVYNAQSQQYINGFQNIRSIKA